MTADLKAAVDEIVKTDYSSASIQSASELFLRFISLIQKENEVNPDFTKIRNEYLTRGQIFIKRISSSRDVIAEWALPLIRNHLVGIMCTYWHNDHFSEYPNSLLQ